ncbi:unnamed protein product [Vitrella brassicaformis CCMP3155]|uniref:Uncharacterized protein n=1 Tax=Vitrella brassicaformis (strain CCMP3155) TaxID=1169540 RepID=A0A0G4EE97_VITBC|nr:unnamed protein product [Vitrella brassicaformis CCMP3155]|eukprot:CEL93669.1 unnamed protein product [Vitrella brassicaformis CCMP3155]
MLSSAAVLLCLLIAVVCESGAFLSTIGRTSVCGGRRTFLRSAFPWRRPERREGGKLQQLQQYGDEYDGLDDDEYLRRRARELADNDAWQFNKMVEHVGTWYGVAQIYQIAKAKQGEEGTTAAASSSPLPAPFIILKNETASIETTIAVKSDPKLGYRLLRITSSQVPVKDGGGAGSARQGYPLPMEVVYYPHDFRAKQGNQIVGNAFTLAGFPSPSWVPAPQSASVPLAPILSSADDKINSQDDIIWTEVGIKSEGRRVRGVFGFQRESTPPDTDAETETGTPPRKVWTLRQLAVIRERLGEPPLANEDAFYGEWGHGLYDKPAERIGQNYFELFFNGHLTLSFPLSIGEGEAGALSLDWTPDMRRYQADRKFRTYGPSLRTFETTEILARDADIYPAQSTS